MLQFPAIVLRYYQERNDENSAYSQAMACIDSTREPFIEHIYQRIVGGEVGFADQYYRDLIEQRVLLCLTYDKMWAVNSTFDADVFQDKATKRYEQKAHFELVLALAMENCVTHSQEFLSTRKTIIMLRLLREDLISQIKQLTAARSSRENESFLQPKLTSEQQTRLINKVCEITGESDGWKFYPKKGILLLACDASQKRTDILDKLALTEACEAEEMRLKSDASKIFIQVTKIDFNKLINWTAADSQSRIESLRNMSIMSPELK